MTDHPTPLDLDEESRRALEIDAVLDAAAGYAATPQGADRLRGTRPGAAWAMVLEELEAVDEARISIARHGRWLAGRLPDAAPALAALAIDELPVGALALRDLASVLLAAADLRTRLGEDAEEERPRLRRLGRTIPDLTAIARPVAAYVGPDGRLLDGASAELDRIRGTLGRTIERLRRRLEAFVHDPAAASTVRDDFVTQRNGRFVIPIRADTPKPVPGIVHASSSSGVTLFVEPLESVELNNEIVRLTEQEAAEQERLLARWADGFRARSGEVEAAVSGLVTADGLQARALFAEATESVKPVLVPGGGFLLREARHPLLDRRLIEEGRRCVPLTLALEPEAGVLVLSGPNTGGKTVALKTVGLAVLMAQCGLHVPAREARLGVFAQLRADIGDRQSIEADLSTFSGHVRSVAQWLAATQSPALFLFDEIGTGTDPIEGAALAQAVLERLLALGVSAVATTHHGALKAWAFTTPGASSAALEFDEGRLAPTYRILMGAAGTSAGIDVASRLGLDPAIVSRARDLIGLGSRQIEAAMGRVRALAAEAEARRDEMDALEGALRDRLREAEERAEHDRERMRREGARALDEVLAAFRERVRLEIAGIEDHKVRARLEREAVRAAARLAASRAAMTRAIAPAEPAPVLAGPFEPAPGLAVRIVSLDRDGVIASVRGDKVDVRMGAATFTVHRGDLAPRAPGPPPERPSRPPATPAGRGPSLEDDGPSEIHLIGRTVDEALPALDRFLDEAARAERAEVRVIHGHGTGRLRAAVRAFLKGHPHVEGSRPGAPREGGDGATVVTLK